MNILDFLLIQKNNYYYFYYNINTNKLLQISDLAEELIITKIDIDKEKSTCIVFVK